MSRLVALPPSREDVTPHVFADRCAAHGPLDALEAILSAADAAGRRADLLLTEGRHGVAQGYARLAVDLRRAALFFEDLHS